MNAMRFMKMKDKKAQSAVEMGVLLIVITAALIAMQTYLKRGIQGRLRQGVDSIGEQYDPTATTSDTVINHVTNMTTNTTSRAQNMVVGQIITGWGYPVDIIRSVEVQTSFQQIHYDNTTKDGYEAVANP